MKGAVALTLGLLLILLAPAAYALPFATPNEMATGAFSESLTITGTTVTANGFLITDTITTTYSGGVKGVAVLNGSEMVFFNGSSTFKADGTFVGRILGSLPGTLQESYSGTGTGTAFQGRGEDRDGAGGLNGFVGLESFNGAYTSETTASGSYTLLAHR
ncbi:MAG TPA: hypothetical protein VLU99_01830 [Nitrososphaerales archaeon]|nr:hypothetical protein [Nitrososphaerales archaeon]